MSAPIRILCLQGYAQSAEIFAYKTKYLRKVFKNDLAELVYIDAPFEVEPFDSPEKEEDSSEKEQPKIYGWFTPITAEDGTKKYCQGVDESIEYVENYMKTHGPFDGLLGFSQGAGLVSLLCARQTKNESPEESRFKFAMIFAGFKYPYAPHDAYYDQIIDVPSMIVSGEADGIISPERSDELATCFVDPVVVKHSGGHVMPTKADCRKAFLEFVTKFKKSE
ncbi:FSH1-domain-containing protein [Basidiobolus meristosporus CBS 931.73]|uniref:FSH1-domain-containing protein n=1 Tax=Basidiobolus meristosporus CBS 931.73 TaxID=1314790 RepID=A0A1Y1XXK6_9FUNG|nr:FSH1-domain-containing protein [Basidiobolus meristosporus CBS 931.73]|eukprot:ORX90483.1 FSH1-domain-containing protein [Basidiobolus meristosporus CBS 931.73]